MVGVFQLNKVHVWVKCGLSAVYTHLPPHDFTHCNIYTST